MNLTLHGLDAPQIDPGNALRFRLGEIGDRERVDVILTNPPFGGEEEPGIQSNFPAGQAHQRDGAAVFPAHHAQAAPPAECRSPRAQVVVPNGTLFGDGVAARIKEELLGEFNLHTIVRLPTDLCMNG